MTSDVTCLETYAKKYKNNTFKWKLNKLNLHGLLDFANTRMLPITCPALPWDQALLSFSWVNRFPAGKANRKVSFRTEFVYLNYVWLWIAEWFLHHLHVHSRDYCDIRRTLNSTPGPSRPNTMHISRHNTSIPRIWTDSGKSRYTVHRVALTKNRLGAPFVALNNP